MALRNSVTAIPLTSRNANTFNNTYLPINAAGLNESCFLLRIINDTNQDVFISYDGVTDHDYIIAANTLQVPFDVSRRESDNIQLKKGTIVYVKAPNGAGLIYLGGYAQAR